MRKVYKVVKSHGGRGYWSGNITPLKKEFQELGLQIRYHVGKMTRPKVKGTPLFAFNTLKWARRWAGDDGDVIFEARATGVKRGGFSYGTPCTVDEITDSLRVASVNKEIDDYRGCLWCSGIKLIRKVKNDTD